MSVISEIERIKTGIANAYTKLCEKNATMPDTQNIDNLVNTIDTIDMTDISSDIKGYYKSIAETYDFNSINELIITDEYAYFGRMRTSYTYENNKINTGIYTFTYDKETKSLGLLDNTYVKQKDCTEQIIKEKILGKWYGIVNNDNVTIEFLEDNTCKMSIDSKETIAPFTIDKNIVVIVYDSPSEFVTYAYYCYFVIDESGVFRLRFLDGLLTKETSVRPLGTKSITENGTYFADDDNFLGYSSVEVNTPTMNFNGFWELVKFEQDGENVMNAGVNELGFSYSFMFHENEAIFGGARSVITRTSNILQLPETFFGTSITLVYSNDTKRLVATFGDDRNWSMEWEKYDIDYSRLINIGLNDRKWLGNPADPTSPAIVFKDGSVTFDERETDPYIFIENVIFITATDENATYYYPCIPFVDENEQLALSMVGEIFYLET